MPLQTGSKIGPYEILAALGAGGMGEVYRARDTRLNREVAIKVLPEHVSQNPELRARFEREARALSAFTHAHICTLHDIGQQDGRDYIVMELLEGESLADRILRGPVPGGQLLRIAIDIADALDKAHRQGVVHRDLKPANIMLTKSGAKLLDFGLARESSPLLSASSMTAMVTRSQPLTTQGTILGTFQYMSPEQLEGREADARSDLFSFGAVLYEMATGKRAFDGKTQASVIAAVLASEPPSITTIAPLAPAALDHVIRTCLAKDPDDRYHSAHDVLIQLRFISQESAVSSASAPAVRRKWWRNLRLAWASATLLAVVATIAGYLAYSEATTPRPVVRASILAPEKLSFDALGDFGAPAALSPNGKFIVFGAHGQDSPKALWVRAIDSLAAQRLQGTENAAFPFWSPDSRSIGFFGDGQLKKIAVGGGPATVLADAVNPRGGSWSKEGTIVFSPNFRGPLFRVDASGGRATPITQLVTGKQTTHRWPWFLPDGKHFLYFATSHDQASDMAGLFLASLDGKSEMVMPNDSAGAYADGQLLFRVQNSLMAQEMDASGKFSGEPVQVVDRIAYDAGTWRMIFSPSESGEIVYQQGSAANGTHLNWYDRSGKQLGTLGDLTRYRDPRISPDGKRVAVCLGDPNWAIWVLDIARGVKARLSFGAGTGVTPSWSADGKWIAYSLSSYGSVGVATVSGARAGSAIHIVATDGSGHDEEVVPSVADTAYLAPEFSPDGRYMQFLRAEGPVGSSVYAVDMKGDRKPFRVVSPANPQGNIVDAHLSPDGKWISYTSSESGTVEIYITSFPGAQGKWQVSSGGGVVARWQGNGKQLIYQSTRLDFISVPITVRGDKLEPGAPQKLFNVATVADGFPFDVSADGQRLLLNVPDTDAASAPLNYVLNWPRDLKRK